VNENSINSSDEHHHTSKKEQKTRTKQEELGFLLSKQEARNHEHCAGYIISWLGLKFHLRLMKC
jgi:hypothetical protein